MNTLADLAQQYLKFPEDTAFVCHRGYRTVRWSYRQTAELAFRFARELEKRGIGKGDRVLLWGDNGPEWIAAFAGAMLRGAVAVPMDRIAAPDFMQRVTDDVQATLVVCSTALAEFCGRWPHLELEDLGETL
ncbi:MAG: acyl--CoA ligase, partial [Acidobacteriia bacterium]|nr:acyl--CoA ligase [Terriglobia bacterium]